MYQVTDGFETGRNIEPTCVILAFDTEHGAPQFVQRRAVISTSCNGGDTKSATYTCTATSRN